MEKSLEQHRETFHPSKREMVDTVDSKKVSRISCRILPEIPLDPDSRVKMAGFGSRMCRTIHQDPRAKEESGGKVVEAIHGARCASSG